MGQGKRPRPKKLGGKLRDVRIGLGISQGEMAQRLIKHGAEKTLHSGYIADYENDKREPSLFTLLAYSRITGLSVNVLIDDKLDLPT
jgi:transcriptional regulator with XRE-family HTH domain